MSGQGGTAAAPPPPPVLSSTSPPTISNPTGQSITIAITVTLAIVTLFVGLRIWGRWRQQTPHASFWPSYGESRFWVFCSDIFILLSFILSVALTAVLANAIHWGQGLHQNSQLSKAQTLQVLKMFYVYQVLYKFAAGMSKIATCFILLAIATQQQKTFIRVTKAAVLFMALTSVSCSIVTVFQCGVDFNSNWNQSLTQEHCFYKPPFWYSHAGLNLLGGVTVAILPWFLFSGLVYKRKYAIASLLSVLAVCEIVFGSVRLRGLYVSATSPGDLTFSASTGLIVSQLEVHFACIAACIPTVFKICEEGFAWILVNLFGIKVRLGGSGGFASNRGPSRYGYGGEHQLSDIRMGGGVGKHGGSSGGGGGLGGKDSGFADTSSSRKMRSKRDYLDLDDDEESSISSRERIVRTIEVTQTSSQNLTFDADGKGGRL